MGTLFERSVSRHRPGPIVTASKTGIAGNRSLRKGCRPIISTTIRHRAKTLMNLEVAFKACMQAFRMSPSRKRLVDKPMETPQFAAGF